MDRAARVLLQDEAQSPMVASNMWCGPGPRSLDSEGLSLHIALFPEDRPQAASRTKCGWPTRSTVTAPGMRREIVHGRGHAVLGPATAGRDPGPGRAAGGVRARHALSRPMLQMLAGMGLDYGPAHRAIDVLHLGQDQVLARLCLPPSVAHTRERFVLHPSLMDGALQAAIGLYLDHRDTDSANPSRARPCPLPWNRCWSSVPAPLSCGPISVMPAVPPGKARKTGSFALWISMYAMRMDWFGCV